MLRARSSSNHQQGPIAAPTLTCGVAAGGPANVPPVSVKAFFSACRPCRGSGGGARTSRGGRLSRRDHGPEPRLSRRWAPPPLLPPPGAWSASNVSSSATIACRTDGQARLSCAQHERCCTAVDPNYTDHWVTRTSESVA